MSSPVKVSLEVGKSYYHCRCGKSADGVLCDGSHVGTGKTPLKFEVKESKEYYLCSCSQSTNKVFCDGSHTKK